MAKSAEGRQFIKSAKLRRPTENGPLRKPAGGPMSAPSDTWYVRLPNGRVVRATSTRSVRRHVGSGRIPTNSRVRRSSKEDWVALQKLPEFADLVVAAVDNGLATPPVLAARHNDVGAHPEIVGVAAHLDPDRLQTIGARGLVEELVAALDCSMVP